MHPDTIKQLIESDLQDCTAIVEGKDGQHFNALIISPEFIGKNRVQKQQLVYRTLDKYIKDGTLHAISIKTFTPEEWQQSTNQ